MFNLLNYMEGVFSMFFLTMIILINVDADYNITEKDHATMKKLCLKMDSTPLSYDLFEVTCSNEITFSYRSAYKGE